MSYSVDLIETADVESCNTIRQIIDIIDVHIYVLSENAEFVNLHGSTKLMYIYLSKLKKELDKRPFEGLRLLL